jgi:plastocyanin
MKTRSLLFLLTLVLQLTACNNSPTTINVTLSDYRYTPSTLTVPAGKEITLNLTNEGFVSHMVIIFKLGTDVGKKFGPEDEENIYWKVEVLPGKSATAKFTAPAEPGEYYVTCGLGGHHEVGMAGKLIVVDK